LSEDKKDRTQRFNIEVTIPSREQVVKGIQDMFPSVEVKVTKQPETEGEVDVEDESNAE